MRSIWEALGRLLGGAVACNRCGCELSDDTLSGSQQFIEAPTLGPDIRGGSKHCVTSRSGHVEVGDMMVADHLDSVVAGTLPAPRGGRECPRDAMLIPARPTVAAGRPALAQKFPGTRGNKGGMVTPFMALVLGIVLFVTPYAQSQTWRTSAKVDPIDGVSRAWAHSDSTAPREKMGFPYHDVTAGISFGCEPGSEWAYITFHGGLNPEGWETIKARVRFDDGPPDQATFYHKHGSDSLHFVYSSWATEKFLAHDHMLLELKWYSEGPVFFDFDLTGAGNGIRSARAKCK